MSTALLLANHAALRVDEDLAELLWRHATENEHYGDYNALRKQIARQMDRGDVHRQEKDASEALRTTLNDSQERLFLAFDDARNGVESLEERTAFALGLALGRRLAGAR